MTLIHFVVISFCLAMSSATSSQSTKRRRDAITALRHDGISDRALFASLAKLQREPTLLSDLHGIGTERMRRLSKEARELPLQKISTKCTLTLQSGSTVQWDIVLPHALLSWFAEHSPGFLNMLLKLLQEHPPPKRLNLILYHDEVTGGNPLRPDNQKKVMIIHWSFREVGLLLRHADMWMPVATIRHSIANQVLGGISGVCRQLCHILFTNSEAGFCVQLDKPTLMFWQLSNLLADESALKSTWASKGAGGIKPCAVCRNVVQKGVALNHAYLRDICEPDADQFDVASNEDIWNAIDHLISQKPVLNKTRMAELEKTMGYHADEWALLADVSLRRFIRPADINTYDSTHCFVSHGVASLELHLFLQACKTKLKIGFAAFKTFRGPDWRTISGIQSSDAAKVFTEVREAATHNSFKGFATEVLAVFPLVRQMATCFGEADDIKPELRSFCAMHDAVNCLQAIKSSHSASAAQCAELQRLQREHMRLFLTAYDAEHVKPKHHFALHIRAQIQRDGMLLDCFCLERKRKFAKTVATRIATNEYFERSLLGHLVATQTQNLTEFRECSRLLGRQCNVSDSSDQSTVSRTMQLQSAEIAVDDILFCSDMAVKVHACISNDKYGPHALVKLHNFIRQNGYGQLWSQTEELYRLNADICFTRPSYWTYIDGSLLTLR